MKLFKTLHVTSVFPAAVCLILAGFVLAGNARADDHPVWAWGFNGNGELGNGTWDYDAHPVPALVQNLDGVVAAKAGYGHSLALKSDGTVWACGRNLEGQLGDGTNTDGYLPKQVPSLSGVAAIAASHEHSLAVKADGTVWAWGLNDYGQLGDGTTSDQSSPVQVQDLSGVIAVAAGEHHSLALKADGTVWAWGRNFEGQLGDGTTDDQSSPVQVQNLGGVIAIAGGAYHSLAVKEDGTVWAWGYNYYGQLGDGTTTVQSSPVQVQNLSGVAAIAAGYHHSIALKSNGAVWAWGYNSYGQAGDGTNTDRHAPVQVQNLSGAVAIAGGGYHSLAAKADGTVWAWGDNRHGELGDTTTTGRSSPVRALNFSGITRVAAGAYHSLAFVLTAFDVTTTSTTEAPVTTTTTTTTTTSTTEAPAITTSTTTTTTSTTAGPTTTTSTTTSTTEAPAPTTTTTSTTTSTTAGPTTTTSTTTSTTEAPAPTTTTTTTTTSTTAGPSTTTSTTTSTTEAPTSTTTTTTTTTSTTAGPTTTTSTTTSTTEAPAPTTSTTTTSTSTTEGSTTTTSTTTSTTEAPAPTTTTTTTTTSTTEGPTTTTSTTTSTTEAPAPTTTTTTTSTSTTAGPTTTTSTTTSTTEAPATTTTTTITIASTTEEPTTTTSTTTSTTEAPVTTTTATTVVTTTTTLPATERLLIIRSENPDSGVAIGVGPLDSAGRGDGITNFDRRYTVGTKVTLTAPAAAGGNAFRMWKRNGAYLTDELIVVVTVTATETYTAVYAEADSLLKVLYPSDAGIVAARNKKCEIHWTSGISQKAKVRIDLVSGDMTWPVVASMLNKGIFKWTVKGNYPDGNAYRIRIATIDATAEDTSDNVFAIGSLSSIHVDGPSSLDENGAGAYSATASYTGGGTKDVTNLAAWSDNTPYVAVAKGGYATVGLIPASGNCQIIAKYGGKAGSKDVSLTNVRGDPTTIGIVGPDAVNEDGSAQYACRQHFTTGPDLDVTNVAKWSDDSPYASVNKTGVLTVGGVPPGSLCNLTVSYGGKKAAKAVTLIDIHGALTGLTIEGPAAVDEEGSATYTCLALYDAGPAQDVTARATWRLSSHAFATLSATGVLTAKAVAAGGVCKVIAGYGGLVQTKDVTIGQVRGNLAGVTVLGPLEVAENETAVYTCLATYDSGNSKDVTAAATWTTTASLAAVKAGLLTAKSVVGDKTCPVKAAFGGKAGTKIVTIKDVRGPLSSLTIIGPAQVAENSTATYTCIAHFFAGTNADVTTQVKWSENSALAAINATGALTVGTIPVDSLCRIAAVLGGEKATCDVMLRDARGKPSWIEVIGPQVVGENSLTQYTCLQHFTFGAPQDVTLKARWSQKSPYAAINKTGALTVKTVPAESAVRITAIVGRQSAYATVTIAP